MTLPKGTLKATQVVREAVPVGPEDGEAIVSYDGAQDEYGGEVENGKIFLKTDVYLLTDSIHRRCRTRRTCHKITWSRPGRSFRCV